MGNCRDDATWWMTNDHLANLKDVQSRLDGLRRDGDPRIEVKPTGMGGEFIEVMRLWRVRIEGAGDEWEGTMEDALYLLAKCGSVPCAPSKIFKVLNAEG